MSKEYFVMKKGERKKFLKEYLQKFLGNIPIEFKHIKNYQFIFKKNRVVAIKIKFKWGEKYIITGKIKEKI